MTFAMPGFAIDLDLLSVLATAAFSVLPPMAAVEDAFDSSNVFGCIDAACFVSSSFYSPPAAAAALLGLGLASKKSSTILSHLSITSYGGN